MCHIPEGARFLLNCESFPLNISLDWAFIITGSFYHKSFPVNFHFYSNCEIFLAYSTHMLYHKILELIFAIHFIIHH